MLSTILTVLAILELATSNAPSPLARMSDNFWRETALKLNEKLNTRRAEVKEKLIQATATLPTPIEVRDVLDGDTLTRPTYGQLPEVLVDQGHGAVFPNPIRPPHRQSWFQVSLTTQKALTNLKHIEAGIEDGEIEHSIALWNANLDETVAISARIRYLLAWIPQLERSSKNPSQAAISELLSKPKIKLISDSLRETLKPHRLFKRSFLPEKPPRNSELIIPVATDIRDQKFLSEMEGAIETHWNQSSWAKSNRFKLKIRWTLVAKNQLFASGKITLLEHLKHFPKDHAIITTGGLTHAVYGPAMVLAPGKINPRTLAHEFGHILGFEDCYLRTLGSHGIMGLLGLLGLAVLEWENPLYPDDLMCDNTVGTARAEVW